MIKFKPNQGPRERVVVAMSGGVDSSVAAALLKKQGYDVIGVFMRFWQEGSGGRNTCCSAGAEQAARNVAAKLGIPFYVLRLEAEFKKSVVDYFLAEEKRARTPNPCVACNKKIKFGLLFNKAMALGADYIATGHYARIVQKSRSKIKNSNQKLQVFKLFCAKDKDKDQSYFLYTLSQNQLRRVLFPLGDYTKDEVYQLAKKWKLPYRRDESFDLCFIARGRENFLKKYLKPKSGKIMSLKQEELGEHPGLAYYTIGQRKNILLERGPWWVVKKDGKKNILSVSDNEMDLYSRELSAGQINWIGGREPKFPAKVMAKIRYKSEEAEAQIDAIKTGIALKFKKPQRAITPGQSVVFYGKNGEVLGGGIIQ